MAERYFYPKPTRRQVLRGMAIGLGTVGLSQIIQGGAIHYRGGMEEQLALKSFEGVQYSSVQDKAQKDVTLYSRLVTAYDVKIDGSIRAFTGSLIALLATGAFLKD